LHREKEKLESDKLDAKSALESYSEEILQKYERAINKHLADFGAGFKICNAGTKYPGGKPTTDYELSINPDSEVENKGLI
jgi:hypothetical protein